MTSLFFTVCLSTHFLIVIFPLLFGRFLKHIACISVLKLYITTALLVLLGESVVLPVLMSEDIATRVWLFSPDNGDFWLGTSHHIIWKWRLTCSLHWSVQMLRVEDLETSLMFLTAIYLLHRILIGLSDLQSCKSVVIHSCDHERRILYWRITQLCSREGTIFFSYWKADYTAWIFMQQFHRLAPWLSFLLPLLVQQDIWFRPI